GGHPVGAVSRQRRGLLRHRGQPGHTKGGDGVVDLDRTNPEAEIAAAAKRCSNWGRWGPDDVRGTMNFLTEDKRVQGAALVRRGVSFSLAQAFDMDGPQKGWRRRTNPVHTMLDTGTDAAAGIQGFP